MKIEEGNLIATAKETQPIYVNKSLMEAINCIKPHVTRVWELQGKDFVCVWEREKNEKI